MIHDLTARLAPLDYLSWRYTIAAVVLFAVAPRAIGRLSRRQVWQSVLLGLLYGFGQIAQTEGVARTSAAVAGFVTGLYVVLTPIFAAPLLRIRVGRANWLSVVLATIGMGVLTLNGFSIGFGEFLVFLSAIVYALQIVGLEAWSKPEIAVGSSTVQLIVIAAMSLVCAAPGGIGMPHRTGDWVSLLYMAIVVGALGMLGQVWAQAHLPATRAAIIMSMEPVFAAFFAVLFGGDHLTGRMVAGGLVVLAAMLLAELVPRRNAEADVTHLAA